MDFCSNFCDPRRLLDNYTLANVEETPFITINQSCSLTETGIFLSSIILSASAFITSVLSQIQKSRCKTIKCLGTSCVRNVDV